MASHAPNDTEMHDPQDHEDDAPAMLDADEGEEVAQDDDAAMDSDADDDEMQGAGEGEIELRNDSIAHSDAHSDSIFCIAQHPKHPQIVATGGGDDCAYVYAAPSAADVQARRTPAGSARASEKTIAKLDGHTDSVNGVAFTFPSGEFVATAGLDGQLRGWRDDSAAHDGSKWALLGAAREVDEINWIAACPAASHPNTLALGASDGSVWVYALDAGDSAAPLRIEQAFYLHTAACTAGAWTPDGSLLATVAEDGGLFVWDVWGDAAAAGVAASGGGQAVVALTAEDERFRVDGGLYSVATSPNGALVAVGGAEGLIRIVGLPRLGAAASASSTTGGRGGGGARAKAGGSKQSGGPKGAEASTGQAGQILAALAVHSDGVETLAFSPSPDIPLLASGSVDGSVALYDTRANFAVRKHLRGAHEDFAVIKVEFAGATGAAAWTLTSCGNDGVVRRWDARGGGGAAGQGHEPVGEYRGHRGDGEGGGVLGFVQGAEGGRYIVTAGDE